MVSITATPINLSLMLKLLRNFLKACLLIDAITLPPSIAIGILGIDLEYKRKKIKLNMYFNYIPLSYTIPNFLVIL